MSAEDQPAEVPQDNSLAAEKVRCFPHTPGVYLMKDAAGRVIYVGKAKNLRARAGSYFLKAAAEDQRTARLVREIRDIDYLEAESEVDALLMEARLIKDILPKYNRDLRDDKTFPYLEIYTHEDFPARANSPATPQSAGHEALRAVRQRPAACAGRMQVLQKIFKFRTCSLDIDEADPRWRWFRPCLLASIGQCTAPCNLRISQGGLPQGHPPAATVPGRQEAVAAGGDARGDGTAAEGAAASRRRPGCATKSTCWKRSTSAANWKPTSSRRSFPSIPRRGWPACRRCCIWPKPPRTIEGIDIAHTAGTETVASVVQFIDGLPFKPGYRRLRIRTVEGVDDLASIREAVARRFQRLRQEGEVVARHPADRRRQGAAARGTGGLGRAGLAPADGAFAGQARGSWSSWPAATSRCG